MNTYKVLISMNFKIRKENKRRTLVDATTILSSKPSMFLKNINVVGGSLQAGPIED